MRQSALLVVALVALAQLAAAQDIRRMPLDGKAVGDALQDFMAEMRTVAQKDAATWRDRASKMRKEVRDRFAAASAPGASVEEATRRRLLTDPVASESGNAALKLQIAKDLLSKSWELVVDLGGAVKNVMSLKGTKVHDFFSDVLGYDWNQWVPPAWVDAGFTFDHLGNFDFSESLQSFLSSDVIAHFTQPQTLGDLYNSMDNLTAKFCEPETPSSPGSKQPTTCVGPMLNITFMPKTCVIDAVQKQIVCDPAKLVLLKVPGSCTLKYYSATTWTGKQCRLKGGIGHKKVAELGGKNHTMSMGDFDFGAVKQWAADLFHHAAPDSASDPVVVPSTTA